eukprot:Em0152g7a
MKCLLPFSVLGLSFLLVTSSTGTAFASWRTTIFSNIHTDYELTINVSYSGNDTLECLAGLLPCQTLEYALKGLENSTVILLESGEHQFAPSDSTMTISRVKDVAIIGETGDETRVTCEDGAGIAFVESRDIVIYGVEWQGCAIAHRSSALHHKLGIAFPTALSRLATVPAYPCTTWEEKWSYGDLTSLGTAATQKCAAEPCYLISRGLTIEFTYCGEFSNCSEPGPTSVYNSGARYSIEDCIFVGNNNSHGDVKPVDSLEGSEYWPYGKGGGIAIAFRGRSSGNAIVMTYTDGFVAALPAFSQNVADLGGSLSVEFLDEASGNKFSLLGSRWSVPVASWGGGFTLFNLPSSDGSAIVSFQNCSWRLNSAKTGADAVGISQLSTTGISGMVIMYSNCTFRENDVIHSAGTSTATYQSTQGFAHCSISTDGLALVFDTVTISDSSGPGLCVSAATVHVKGEVQFVSNGLRTRPVYGGGLLLQSSSSVVLSKGVQLLFENNSALYYGGGIYYGGASTTLPRGGQRYSQYTCVFDYEDALVPVEEWSSAGRGMYLAGVVDDQCKSAMANITRGSPREDFASTGTSVQLHPPAERIGPNTYKMDVMYGQYLTLNATATDYYDNVVEMMLRLGSNSMSEVYLLLTDLVKHVLVHPYQLHHQKGYWYGELQMENTTMPAIAPCSPDHCDYIWSRCNTACDDLNSFCLLSVFVDLTSGMTQLNPRFLGLVQWCAFDSLSTLGYWMVRYLHPLVFLLLMSFVSILKCGCKQFPRIPTVHILCILIVVVFSSLNRDQPEAAHPAAAIECVLLIPTSLLLVFGPLLAKPKCSRGTHLRGILGEYQVCYRKGFRWAVGFYFLARQAMFLVPVLCWSAEPYKMAWLNVVDALLLFDLAFVALLNNGAPFLRQVHLPARTRHPSLHVSRSVVSVARWALSEEQVEELWRRVLRHEHHGGEEKLE